MKLGLALRFQNEAAWLNLHLRYMVENSKALDGVVALDGGSSDGGREVVESLGGKVYDRKFDWDFGAHANGLLDAARAEGYTHVIRLDPDEILSLDDLVRVRKYLGTYDSVWLRFTHFAGDRLHHVPEWEENDKQARAFKIRPCSKYLNKVHEVLTGFYASAAETDIKVHHFGYIEPMEIRQLQLTNYARLIAGEPPLAELPPDSYVHLPPKNQPYTGYHVLSPYDIGTRAPFRS